MILHRTVALIQQTTIKHLNLYHYETVVTTNLGIRTLGESSSLKRSITAMTHNLWSHTAWLNYYQSKVNELSHSFRCDPAAFKSQMWDICKAAINSRKQELRNSDSYQGKKWTTAAAGLIPLLKIGVSISVCEDFAQEALCAFGLSDTAGLEEMARQLKLETSGRDDLLIDVLGTLGKLSMAEFLAHHGTHAASEVWHVQPILGQITNAGISYAAVRKRLISIIEKTSAAARDVHKEILIPMVISKAL
jgi:hypothetical protein